MYDLLWNKYNVIQHFSIIHRRAHTHKDLILDYDESCDAFDLYRWSDQKLISSDFSW